MTNPQTKFEIDTPSLSWNITQTHRGKHYMPLDFAHETPTTTVPQSGRTMRSWASPSAVGQAHLTPTTTVPQLGRLIYSRVGRPIPSWATHSKLGSFEVG